MKSAHYLPYQPSKNLEILHKLLSLGLADYIKANKVTEHTTIDEADVHTKYQETGQAFLKLINEAYSMACVRETNEELPIEIAKIFGYNKPTIDTQIWWIDRQIELHQEYLNRVEEKGSSILDAWVSIKENLISLKMLAASGEIIL